MKNHIINNDGSIRLTQFTFNNKEYKLIGTHSIGWKALQAIDTLKNVKTNTIIEIERLRLFLATRK